MKQSFGIFVLILAISFNSSYLYASESPKDKLDYHQHNIGEELTTEQLNGMQPLGSNVKTELPFLGRDLQELKRQIQDHYDMLSPYYQDLWGHHIHHGYWITGDETKELAQLQLILELARRSGLDKREQESPKILDVGCGVGGGSIWLSKMFAANVTGISISPTQIEMAKTNAAKENLPNIRFLHMDAEHIQLQDENGTFDYVWIVEVMSHFAHKEQFMKHANRMLKVGGKIAIADWLRAEHLTEQQVKDYIIPIEDGMLLPQLNSLTEYVAMLNRNGFRIKFVHDISEETKKTWDICLDLVASPSLWTMAWKQGTEFLNFLRAFQAMRSGFSSQTFVYGLLVAEKVVDLL